MHLVSATDPVLRRKCRKVDDPTRFQDTIEQLDDMRQRMQGLGLAAPQVGIAKRFFVTRFAACFNPKVLKRSPQYEEEIEGCLSFPDIQVPVSRPSWVEVRYQDEQGEEVEVTLWGLDARVFLHELDHLDGKLITDYL